MDKDEILDELFWELKGYAEGYCNLDTLVTDVWRKAYYQGMTDYREGCEHEV